MDFQDSGVFYNKVNKADYTTRGLSGLSNLGNTCYLNTAIQCLSNTLILTDYFKRKTYLEDINEEKVESHLVKEWARLLEGIWNSNCTIAPHSFIHVVNILALKNGFVFGGGRQYDLQEFLVFFIDTMHNALSQEVSITISGEVKNNIDKMATESMNRWKQYFKNDYSIFVEIFYGQLCTKIICPGCKHFVYTYDPFCYLSVPLPDNVSQNKITLEDCIECYTQLETLDSDNQWECEKCKKKQNAIKKDNFWKLPKILIIHLKRFNKNNGLKKNNDYVDYPLTNLDLSKYCTGYERNDICYNLYGVGCHEGSLNQGHYYSYCLNADENWYWYNDSSVTRLNKESVISQSAYCLFYMR